MSKSKISDIRYYSKEIPKVEYYEADNILGYCCLEMLIFLICFIFAGPLILVIGIMWLLTRVWYVIYHIKSGLWKNKNIEGDLNIFLTIEEARWMEETNTSMLAVMFMEKPWDISELKNIVTEKVLNFNKMTNKCQNISQRFRRKAQKIGSYWKWLQDLEFTVENHILPLNTDSSDLSNLLEEITNRKFDISHPLWNLFLVNTSLSHCQDMNKIKSDPQQSPNNLIPANSAVILKIHPSITDGISLLKLLTEVINDTPEPMEMKLNKRRQNLFFKVCNTLLYGSFIFFKSWYLNKLKQDICEKCTVDNSVDPASDQFLYCNFSMKEITRLKLITRSTFGEIILSLLSSGIKYHHTVLSDSVQTKDCQCLVTVDMSRNSHRLNYIRNIRNDLSFYHIELPVTTEGIIPILWALKRRMKVLKSSSDYVFHYLFPKIFSQIFSFNATNKVMKCCYDKPRIIFSSFIGTPKQVIINENKTKNILFWFPLFGLLSISIACFSYNDQFTVCIRGKNSKFVNLQILLNSIKYQLNHLSKLLENRRVPGEKSIYTNFDHFVVGINQTIAISDLTINQILKILNDLQIKIQDKVQYSGEEIQKMKLNFSILFSALRDKKKNNQESVDFQEIEVQPDVSRSRKFSLPAITKVIRKNSLKRLSFSRRELKITEIDEKIFEDEETGVK